MCAGNTCFLNSIVQVLYYSPMFVNNVKILCDEMRITISENNLIRTVTVVNQFHLFVLYCQCLCYALIAQLIV